MKNKFIALALITLSVATTTVSCTKDDANPTDVTKAVQTADATISFNTEKDGTTAKSTVERGTLHAWIKDVNLHGGAMELSHVRDFSFELVPDGTLDAAKNFTLDKLAIGRNDFEVTTTTSTAQDFHTEWSNTPSAFLMEHISARNPYATYGAHLTTDIKFGVNNNIAPVELKTQHGRHIAIFKLGEALGKLGVYAIVTPIVDGVTKAEMGIPVNLNGLCYWSDEKSLDGKTIQYDIKLMRGDHNPLMDNGVQIGFKSILITIKKSTSINRIYTITKDALTENSSVQMFSAEEWISDNGSEEIIGN